MTDRGPASSPKNATDALASTRAFPGNSSSASSSPRVTYSSIDQTNLKPRGATIPMQMLLATSPLSPSTSKVSVIDDALSHFNQRNSTTNKGRPSSSLPSSPSTRASHSISKGIASSSRQGSNSPLRGAAAGASGQGFMAPTASAATRTQAIQSTNSPTGSRRGSPSRQATFNPSGNFKDTPNAQVHSVRTALLKATTNESIALNRSAASSPSAQPHQSTRDFAPWDPNNKRSSVFSASLGGSHLMSGGSVCNSPSQGRPLFPTSGTPGTGGGGSRSPMRGGESRLFNAANSMSPMARGASSMTGLEGLDGDGGSSSLNFGGGGATFGVSNGKRVIAPIDFFDASGYMRRAAASGDLFSHCGFTSNSKEGRILTLVKNFQQNSLFRWHRKVKEIANRSNRSAYLKDDDAKFLENVLARNVAFMRNLESIIAEAATAPAPPPARGPASSSSADILDCGVIRFAYAAFEQSTQFNNAISLLLIGNAPQLKQLQKDRQGAEEAMSDRLAYLAGGGTGPANSNNRSPQKRRNTEHQSGLLFSTTSSSIPSPFARHNVVGSTSVNPNSSLAEVMSARLVVRSTQVAAAMRAANNSALGIDGEDGPLIEFGQEGLADDGLYDEREVGEEANQANAALTNNNGGEEENKDIKDFPPPTPPAKATRTGSVSPTIGAGTKAPFESPQFHSARSASVFSDAPSIGPSAVSNFHGPSFVRAATTSGIFGQSMEGTSGAHSPMAGHQQGGATSPSRARGSSLPPPALPVSTSRSGDASSTAAALWGVGGAGAFIGGGGNNRLITAEESLAFNPDEDDEGTSVALATVSLAHRRPSLPQVHSPSAQPAPLGASSHLASSQSSGIFRNNATMGPSSQGHALVSSFSVSTTGPSASTIARQGVLAAAVMKAHTKDEGLATALTSAPVTGTTLADTDVVMYMGSRAVGGAGPPNIRFNDRGLPLIGATHDAARDGSPSTTQQASTLGGDSAVFADYLSRLEKKRQEELYQPLQPQTTSAHRDPNMLAKQASQMSALRGPPTSAPTSTIISRQPHYRKPLQRVQSPLPSGAQSLLSANLHLGGGGSRSPSRRNSPTRAAGSSSVRSSSPTTTGSLQLVSASSGFRPPHLSHMDRSEQASRGLHNVYGGRRGQSPTTFEVVSNLSPQHPNSTSNPNIVYDFTGTSSRSQPFSHSNTPPQQHTYDRSISGASSQMINSYPSVGGPSPTVRSATHGGHIKQTGRPLTPPSRPLQSAVAGRSDSKYGDWEYDGSAPPGASTTGNNNTSTLRSGSPTQMSSTATLAPTSVNSPITMDRARRMALLEYIEVLTLKRNGVLTTPQGTHGGKRASITSEGANSSSGNKLSEREIKSAHTAFLEMYGERDGNRQFYAWLAAGGR